MTSIGGLLALDAQSGNTIWAVPEMAGMMPGAAIDTSANSIVAAGGDGLLLTLSLRDGSVIRSAGLGSADGMSSARVDEHGVVVIGAASTLESYSSRTGDVKWTFRPSGGIKAFGDVPVAVSHDAVFTTGTRNVGLRNAFHEESLKEFLSLVREGFEKEKIRTFRNWFHEQTLFAIDRNTGRVLWKQPLGIGLSVTRNQSGTPVLRGDRVVVSSPVSQTVLAFGSDDGRLLWKRRLSAMHKGAVTIVGDDIVLGDKDGRVILLRLADGALVGRCTAKGSFSVTAPVIVGKTFIAATRDGDVWATPYDSLRSRAVRGQACY
jgi:outer membrane protein assembly factor BamB